jgi:starch phosphorylase
VQDRSDAESLARILSEEVVPRFFARDESGLPRLWIQTMKASIESVVAPFSAIRMVRDYLKESYLPASERK